MCVCAFICITHENELLIDSEIFFSYPPFGRYNRKQANCPSIPIYRCHSKCVYDMLIQFSLFCGFFALTFDSFWYIIEFVTFIRNACGLTQNEHGTVVIHTHTQKNTILLTYKSHTTNDWERICIIWFFFRRFILFILFIINTLQ